MKRALLLLVPALFAACSTKGEPRSTAPSPTPSASGLEIVSGEPCPLSPDRLDLPDGTGCASNTLGEFEPGTDEQELVVYADLDASDFPSRWHLRLVRPGGESLDEVVAIGSRASYPLVLGAEDADRDGLDEAFVRVLTHTYHSGATHEVGIFGVRDSHFFRVRSDEGPLVFQVGGVSVFGEGAECRDIDADGTPEFLLLRIDGVTNDVQTWSERTYRWKDRSLVFVGRREGTMAKTGYTDPLLLRFYSLRCFGFEPPYPYARG